MARVGPSWPNSDEELAGFQPVLAERAKLAARESPWAPPAAPAIAGCAVAFAPGGAGDRAWAAAVLWRPRDISRCRKPDRQLRGVRPQGDLPRQARDIDTQVVIADRVRAAYHPGLLARREGPILAQAIDALDSVPDLVMVDATGEDHPRRAGLAIHLGYALGIPSVGVTTRPLTAAGEWPPLIRGSISPVRVHGHHVGYWVCTRTRVRPVVAHAAWRTDPRTAAHLVLFASTEASRTPIPLQEARRVAREARTLQVDRDGP